MTGQQQYQQVITERLHTACQQTPPDLVTIRALVRACPSAVRERNNTNNNNNDLWLPLHRACRRQPSLAVIETLVQAWPESTRQWTSDAVTEARLPLHLACQYGAPVAVVAYLVQQDPSSRHAVSSPKQRYTALDFALYYYHQRRQSGLDVTEAERVVHYLANDHHVEPELKEATIKREDPWESEKHHLSKVTILPTAVHAYPLQEAFPVASPEQDNHPQQEKPQAKPMLLRPRFPSVVPKSSSSSSTKKSKIIRMKLPRPSVPLR
uniref:Uncharacterized protein n=1 Tax=Amphora coffeiformis TaxID=265554 RepID=A0A7S3P6H6_9STRA|mmetsp:Transcript_5345/g.10591  ORF Transcript_5345/g.10591 Transcript_5345/m.10591 type:complete len:266 (+) Transcript_5345:232-1029(+)|eukprot:scaffold426_cov219-Amphora_coffeaeformis.AAC.50